MAWFQSHSLWIQEFTEGLAVLQFDPPGKSVRMTAELQDELDAALVAIEAEPRFRAVLIRSQKPGRFVQGPDVAGWKSLQSAGKLNAWCERGQQVWNRLRGLRIPTVAWVNGICQSAGLELALACDQIIVVDHPLTVFGFAELDIGLIPSWGGLGQLARRVGLQGAFPIALAGRRLSAREAVAMGLADGLTPGEEPVFEQILSQARKRDTSVWSRRSWRQRLFEPFARGRKMVYRGVEKLQLRRLPDELPAPRLALRVLKAFVEEGTAAGQTAAKTAMAELAGSRAFANLIRLHELRERAGKNPGSVRGKTIGVVGANPLAMHLVAEIVRRDGSVVLRETDETRLGMAVLMLVKSLGEDIQAGKLTAQESKKYLGRIRSTVTWKNFDETQFIVDTRESSEQRAAHLAEIDANAPVSAPILSIGAGDLLVNLGQTMAHPERLVGAAMPTPIGAFTLAEWRRGASTTDDAAKAAREWLSALGWMPIETGDMPGMLVIRLWAPAWNEMVLLLREGARLDWIDQAMVRFGLGRGPLEFLDTLGLETARRIIESVGGIEPRIPIDPFWSEVLSRGWRGQASGKGFYRHRRGLLQVNHLLVNWLRADAAPSAFAKMSKDEQLAAIEERVILLMVNEAFRCLDEKRVASADDLDLAMMLTDWAPHRGGPIQYARDVGVDKIVERLRRLEVHGPRYEPCAGLK